MKSVPPPEKTTHTSIKRYQNIIPGNGGGGGGGVVVDAGGRE